MEKRYIKDQLYKLYWEDKLTQEEIGKYYGKSRRWVFLQMKKYNIPTKDSIDIKTRFLNHVKIPENPNDCWEWIGSKTRKGYGQLSIKGKNIYAHRISYILYVRYFDPTLCVLHKCDNPSCVNPNHLFLGNKEDNNKDRTRKGRGGDTKGEKHGMSKLTNDDVKRIKKLLVQGIPCIDIVKAFKVCKSNISSIKHNHTWKHIE